MLFFLLRFQKHISSFLFHPRITISTYRQTLYDNATVNWQHERFVFAANLQLIVAALLFQYIHSVATNVAYFLHIPREVASRGVARGLMPCPTRVLDFSAPLCVFISSPRHQSPRHTPAPHHRN